LLAPFALNALDESEHRVVSAHIESCTECAQSAADLLDTSSLVALSTDEAPPERVWTNLQIAMKTDPQPAAVLDLAQERVRRNGSRRRSLVMALSAAAAVVLVTVPLARSNRTTPPTMDNLALSAAKAKGSRTVDLVSVDATKQKVGEVVLTSDGRGYLRVTDLPQVTDDQTYQLWAIIDGKPISEGLLGRGPTVAAFSTGANEQVQAIAVSVEKSTGATAPTIGPIAIASL
jgi:anti-sigma-K factor RskA